MVKGRIPWLALGLAYVSLGLLARLGGWYHYWDTLGLVEVSRTLLKGDLNIYILNYGEPAKLPYTAYPPILPCVLAPFVYLSDVLLGNEHVTFALAGLPLLVFDFFAVYVLIKIVSWKVGLQDSLRVPLAIMMLFSLGIFHSSAYMSHPESMTLLFVLLGIWLLLRNRPLLAGVSLSFAILSKHTAILAILPIIFIYLKDKVRSEGLTAVSFMLALLIPVLLVLYPFYITNPDATWDALLGHTARLRLRHESIWKALDVVVQRLAPADVYSMLHEFLMVYTVPMPLIGALAVSASALLLRIRMSELDGFLSAITLSAYLQLIISKTVAPHYYVVPLGLLVLWDATRRKGLPFFGLAASLWLWSIHSVEWSHPIGALLLLSNVAIAAKVLHEFLNGRRQPSEKAFLQT